MYQILFPVVQNSLLMMLKNIQCPSDIVHLQHNLDLLNNWSLKGQLYLNISKCNFTSHGNTLDAVYTITDLATGERVQLSKCFKEKILEYGILQI